MSDNRADRDEPFANMDRRVRRTRLLLADALFSLGDKDADIDALDIAALTEEAGISRSTFYQHFASKDDFMVRSFVDLLGAAEAAMAQRFPERTSLLPAGAIFAHIADAPGLVRTVVRSSYFGAQMNAGELKLRQIAEANLARLNPDWDNSRRAETAVYVAAGFIGLLRWWMQSGLKQPPDRMHQAFNQLTHSALAE